MRKILIIAILIFIGLCGCGAIFPKWDYFYPYCKSNPARLSKPLPITYEDCLAQFDSVLSDKVINYFRTSDSTIASIEISQELGGLFRNYWKFSLNSGDKQIEYLDIKDIKYKHPWVLQRFIIDGVYDPEAMIRILFNCYYKKLNNIPYNWEEEIQKLKSYWIPYKYGLSKEMRKRENDILADYRFNLLEVGDTVDVLYNQAPRLKLLRKTPDWYYLTGIIQYKLPKCKAINVKLTDIQSEFKKNYIIEEKDTIVIGDTLTDYSYGWLKRGIYYLNYQRNKEYRDK